MDRLQQLHLDIPTEGWFGFRDTASGVGKAGAQKPPPPKVFIETTTQDQMEDIESTKQKITSCLEELNRTQKKAFEAQKEKMKICYNFFGKYEGTYQSSEWARRFWFDLHDVDPDRQKTQIPEDWVEKMRFWRPDPDDQYRGVEDKQQKKNKEESRRDMKAYATMKEDWERYVDSKWDAAFDDAFGVKQFLEFLGKFPEKIGLKLETTAAKTVGTTWFDLYKETQYFHEKISVAHVRCEGNRFDLMKDDYRKSKEYDEQIRQWKERPVIVQEFYDKVQDLLDYVEILNSLTTVEWNQTIIVDANGKEVPKYVRYDPIQRRNIYRDKPPVKMTRVVWHINF